MEDTRGPSLRIVFSAQSEEGYHNMKSYCSPEPIHLPSESPQPRKRDGPDPRSHSCLGDGDPQTTRNKSNTSNQFRREDWNDNSNQRTWDTTMEGIFSSNRLGVLDLSMQETDGILQENKTFQRKGKYLSRQIYDRGAYNDEITINGDSVNKREQNLALAERSFVLPNTLNSASPHISAGQRTGFGKGTVASVLEETLDRSVKEYTRCSVQAGSNRTFCSPCRTFEGRNFILPNSLRFNPRGVNSATQTLTTSFSAPENLNSVGVATVTSLLSNQGDLNRAPRADETGRLLDCSGRQGMSTEQDLPTYDEVAMQFSNPTTTEGPPRYEELFGTNLGETQSHLGNKYKLSSRTLSNRVRSRPSSGYRVRPKRKKCCGMLSDLECLILFLANGCFLLIFILAAVFSK